MGPVDGGYGGAHTGFGCSGRGGRGHSSSPSMATSELRNTCGGARRGGNIGGGGWAGANGRKQMAFGQITSTKFNFEFQIRTTYLIYPPPQKKRTISTVY